MARKDHVILEVNGLTVSYGEVNVLDGMDMSVGEGEFVAVVGESGCGKTTMLSAIAGFVPHRGMVVRPERVGVVFQNHAVFPWMSVEENIGFGMRDPRGVEYYLETIALKDKRRSYSFELSGGQVQRVALARTLAAQPELILMDEPYGALDVYTRERMQQWLLDIWERERKTIVLVTHSIEEAAFLADRVLVLKDKKITSEFSIKLSRPRARDIRFERGFVKLVKKITESLNGL